MVKTRTPELAGLRRSCAKEEEESVLILARARSDASERAYISRNSFREIISSPDHYALFQLVEGRLPDPLDAHEVLDRTVWAAVDDPLRGGWADARQGVQFCQRGNVDIHECATLAGPDRTRLCHGAVAAFAGTGSTSCGAAASAT